MKKVIVTGATGFIGNHLVKCLLDKEVRVYAIIRNMAKIDSRFLLNPNFIAVQCDLSNIYNLPNFVGEEDIDVFYHLAWEGASGIQRSDSEIQIQNVKNGLACLIIAEKMHIKKFVTTGTIGENLADSALNNNLVSENYVYAISKSYLHKLLQITVAKFHIKLVWCTLSGIYGEGDSTANLVNYTILSFFKGETPKFGSGTQLFDFLHVDDCAFALYLIGNQSKFNYYYVGSGFPKILKKYLFCIRKCFGEKAEINLGARKDDGTRYLKKWFDTKNLVDDFQFSPSISFENGINRLISYYKNGINKNY
jgi:nucleoside-diphosphate-sugar epimerase